MEEESHMEKRGPDNKEKRKKVSNFEGANREDNDRAPT